MRTITCLLMAVLVSSELFSSAVCGGAVKPFSNIDCPKSNVELQQSQEGTEPNGIPIFTVQIVNNCPNGCQVSNIHIDCGEFNSDILVNPNTFKRINIGDCLVNDGKPLAASAIISFKYATTSQIPMSVLSLECSK